MSLQGKIEAIIYAAEEPVTLDQLATLLKRDVLAELEAQAASDAQAASEVQAAAAAAESATTAPVEASAPAEAQTTPDTVPPDAPAETSTGSEEPSEARQHPERAPESQEPLSVPEPLQAQDSSTSASVNAPTAIATKRKKAVDPELARVKAHLRGVMETVIASYTTDERGVEIRQIAGGFRMATKPEHHDLVRAFAKALKPPIKLSLQALETLAIIAYKQPVTGPEIGEIRGVDSGGVLGTLLERKLITTAGRKQVIGRPIQYKTTKEFLMRFGMNDLGELPSMEEFEKLAQEQTDMFSREVPAETGPAPSDETLAEEEDAAEVASGAKDESVPDSEPQRPPEEPQEPADAGDRSDGADTSETIVREQMENEK